MHVQRTHTKYLYRRYWYLFVCTARIRTHTHISTYSHPSIIQSHFMWKFPRGWSVIFMPFLRNAARLQSYMLHFCSNRSNTFFHRNYICDFFSQFWRASWQWNFRRFFFRSVASNRRGYFSISSLATTMDAIRKQRIAHTWYVQYTHSGLQVYSILFRWWYHCEYLCFLYRRIIINKSIGTRPWIKFNYKQKKRESNNTMEYIFVLCVV